MKRKTKEIKMLKYNLCLIKQGNRILLLNREFPTWMGRWNGVGGKLEKGESPRDSVLREVYEETEIDSPDVHFKGLITWASPEGAGFGGLYLYLADLPEDYEYQTPIKTDEGILDWKEIDWILHPENQGMASNIPACLDKVLDDDRCFNHHSIFAENSMVDQVSTVIDPGIENDEGLREDYLKRYVEEVSSAR